ncbi:MAG: tetratricopeptide repeat protein [Spirosomataceae bacterium]
MQGERLKILKEWIAENPEDPFNWYSLALEYRKTDREEALGLFLNLQKQHPGYVPTYYPLAQMWMEVEQWDQALQVVEEGIRHASEQSKTKISQELNGLKRQIEDEMLLD